MTAAATSVQLVPVESIERKIFLIRGCKVMLDSDLAELYRVPTKVLNQAVRRNIARFPADFMFQLNAGEMENWRSQIMTSNPAAKMGVRRRPYAFTEHGVAMLSSVLRSNRALELNILIIRALFGCESTWPRTRTWPESWKMSNAPSNSTARISSRFMTTSNGCLSRHRNRRSGGSALCSRRNERRFLYRSGAVGRAGDKT